MYLRRKPTVGRRSRRGEAAGERRPTPARSRGRADAPAAVEERGEEVVPEHDELVLRHPRKEPLGEHELLQQKHDLHHEHRNHPRKDPLPREHVVLSERQHPRHDAPRGVEDGDLQQDAVLVNHDFALDLLRAEAVVDLARVHVHEHVVRVLQRRKVVERRLAPRVLVGVQLEGLALVPFLRRFSRRALSDVAAADSSPRTIRVATVAATRRHGSSTS